LAAEFGQQAASAEGQHNECRDPDDRGAPRNRARGIGRQCWRVPGHADVIVRIDGVVCSRLTPIITDGFARSHTVRHALFACAFLPLPPPTTRLSMTPTRR